ncbi:MAG TPA: 50S ribosomal protein L25 [Pirellulaceae bacterium]|nr:50S ribosomal protein L25 [Pirellulaceae bacterium]
MPTFLPVQRREKIGSANTRRLRKTGVIPAVLYGHGEATLSLSVPADALLGVIRHGQKLVTLQGDAADAAFIKAVQWDVWGKDVLHVDLLRVSETELVETTVRIELRGTAPGISEGGIIEHLVHEIEIDCPAASVPDKITVMINELHLDGSIAASDVKLPEGAKLLSDPDAIIVHCIKPHVAEETPAAGVAEPGAVEPELIRKEKAEEGEEAAAE